VLVRGRQSTDRQCLATRDFRPLVRRSGAPVGERTARRWQAAEQIRPPVLRQWNIAILSGAARRVNADAGPGSREGQGEGEPGAVAGSALHPDPPTLRLHDAPGDGETEAGAPAALVLRLPEALEHVGQVLGRDAGAAVLDAHHHLPPLAPGANRDPAAGRGE